MKSAQNIYKDVMRNEQEKRKLKPHNKLLKNIQNLIRHFIFILEFLKMHLIILSFIFCSLLFWCGNRRTYFCRRISSKVVTASCEPPNTGGKQLAIARILAAFTLFVVTFLVGITVQIPILNAAFRTVSLKTSFPDAILYH